MATASAKHMLAFLDTTGGSSGRRRHTTGAHQTQSTGVPPIPPSEPSRHEKPRIAVDSSATTRRRTLASTFFFLAATSPLDLPLRAAAESWGSRSYIKERYFQPDISPEDAAARIQQTADGMRDMRHMLDAMAWRYVLRYVRLKTAYLSSDLKNAMAVLPESRRGDYVRVANQLLEEMSQLDYYIRTPKVYESYIYYERTLKSLDNVVAMLA